jgi:hypothetical protein
MALKYVTKKNLLIIDKAPYQKVGENKLMLTVGKFKGHSIEEVYKNQPSYVYWIGSETTKFRDEIIKFRPLRCGFFEYFEK